MAAKALGSRDCAVAICGQPALAADDFHVAANFAGVFKAPVLFIVRADAGASSAAAVSARAEGYGLTALGSDGGDAEAVRDAVRGALDKVRGGAPALLVLAAPADSPEGLRRHKASGPASAALARQADAAIERAFAAARDGVRPGLPSLTRGVFAEETPALHEQVRDLLGVRPIPDEEV
jgi:TPP-dependent pyruvate/acetoin dehydrogenase alpha subunit